MEKIVIAGATGLIGKALCMQLQQKYKIVVLTRSAKKAGEALSDHYKYIEWSNKDALVDAVSSAKAVVNLAGSNIGQLWTPRVRAKILKSRIAPGKTLTWAIAKAPIKPKVFVQASATGYYDHDYHKTYDESATSEGGTFLQTVCYEWENATKSLKENIDQYIIIRMAMVLDKNKGVFPKVYLPFRFFAGGKLGGGKQWVSWMHLKDTVNAIQFLIENNKSKGIYNLSSPNPVKQAGFAKKIAQVSKKPYWFHVPAPLLRTILGRMAKETLLASQRVIPKRIVDEGFVFTFPDLGPALKNLMNNQKK
jgi:uncharacterized protein